MDDNGDRIADYWLWHLNPDADEFEFLAEINITTKSVQVQVYILLGKFI